MRKKLLSVLIAVCVAVQICTAAAFAADTDTLTVVLDPGHGGEQNGATAVWDGQTILEKNLNLSIAKYCQQALRDKYQNVQVYLTRSADITLSLEERVNYASRVGADVLVSMHNNAKGDAQDWTDGAEALIPNGNYRESLTTEIKRVAGSILGQLNSRTGIINRGFIQRSSSSRKYPNGKIADYYGLIRSAVLENIPCTIIEHAFMDNEGDYRKYLSSEEKLKVLGEADAAGIAEAYGLKLKVPTAAQNGDAPFTDIYADKWYYSPVVFAYQNGLLKGTSETTFSPDDTMSRAMVTQALYSYAGKPDSFNGTEFSDVPAGSWYEQAVLWASENGVVSGIGDGQFAPMQDITREEFVQILYRFAGSKEGSGSLENYPDAQAVSVWAQEAMCWAVETGIVAGEQTDDGVILLNPKVNATRAQAAAMLCSFVEKVNEPQKIH